MDECDVFYFERTTVVKLRGKGELVKKITGCLYVHDIMEE
jgi:hypothetical protein